MNTSMDDVLLAWLNVRARVHPALFNVVGLQDTCGVPFCATDLDKFIYSWIAHDTLTGCSLWRWENTPPHMNTLRERASLWVLGIG